MDKTKEVPEAWMNLIKYCQTILPHGEIQVRIVNGLPTDLVGEKKRIRFDKDMTVPITRFEE